jgi:hypothetical protein
MNENATMTALAAAALRCAAPALDALQEAADAESANATAGSLVAAHQALTNALALIDGALTFHHTRHQTR